MSVLEMKHIQKSFGEFEVLKDISLEVNKGDVLSIIGPSGSGKSTLLRCAVNLEKISGGKIEYNDKLMADTNENGIVTYAPKSQLKELKSTYGLVFQNFNPFSTLFSLEKHYRCSFKCSKKRQEGSGRNSQPTS